jgi:hypothetical protein
MSARTIPPAARARSSPAWPDKPRGIGAAQTGNVGNNTGKGCRRDNCR